MLIEILIVLSFGDSLIIILAIDCFIITTIIFVTYLKDLPVYLLILNIIPLIYFNLAFHYTLKWVLIQDIFVFVVLYLALLKFIVARENELSDSPFKTAILIVFSYFCFSAVYGFLRGHQLSAIEDELYHIFYYLLILILTYILNKEKQYISLITAIGIIITAISLEYIVIFVGSGFSRFVTFQSNLILIMVAVSFSFSLFYRKKRIFWLSIFFINLLGLVACQTRTLWVSAFLILAIIAFYYIKVTNKRLLTKLLMYGLILLLPAVLFSSRTRQNDTELKNNQQLGSRAQSIKNPTEDASFIMRLELGYYAFQKFMKNPIIGSGLGDYVKYKIFKNSDNKIYYIDSTWLYMLWKGGIIGFLLFAWIYLLLLKNALFIFKKANELIIKILSLSVFAATCGLIITGFFVASLNKYKYGVIIAILFAFIDFEKRKLVKIST
ncbi:MAG: O-antigen ligase family protein [Ignavibacteriaceae bacterium]